MIRKSYLALGLVLACQPALAVGLGDVEQQSGLGQPFLAEVPVTGSEAWEVEELRVWLRGESSAELIQAVEVDVVEQAGERVIRLRTDKAVREPFMDLAVVLGWPEGKLRRDYAMLLDPPGDN